MKLVSPLTGKITINIFNEGDGAPIYFSHYFHDAKKIEITHDVDIDKLERLLHDFCKQLEKNIQTLCNNKGE